MNKDHLIIGLIAGILLPSIGCFIYYCIVFMPQHVSLIDFLHLVFDNKQNIPKIISLSLLANLPVFIYFKNRRCDKSMKGIFIATLLYALLIILYKLNLL